MVFTENRDDEPMDGRRVYFNQPDAEVEDGTNENFHFPDNNIVGSIRNVVPNGYAVVGSSGIESGNAFRTTFGRRTDATIDHANHSNTDLNIGDTRGITLTPGFGVSLRKLNELATDAGADSDGFDDPLQTVNRDCVAVPINLWSSTAEPRSLGISDPDQGYVNSTMTGALQTAYPALTATEFDPDGMAGNADGDGLIFSQILPQPADVLISNAPQEVLQDGNHMDFRYVQLQRLANPQAPYNADSNPYITVDTAPVDLITFNGCSTGQEDGPTIVPATDTDFHSAERGQENEQRNIWQPLTQGFDAPSDFSLAGVDEHHFSRKLTESFGELNMSFIDSQYTQMGLYKTDPLPIPNTAFYQDMAFPWFTWNNRPFISAFELMSVPRGDIEDEDFVNNHYRAPSNVLQNFTLPIPQPPGRERSFHLAFTAESTDGEREFMGGGVNNAQGDLWRLLEFVEVPSRFLGTEYVLDANTFDGKQPDDLGSYNPPYNRLPRYRNPGKVNLNTISDPRVWEALMGKKQTGVDGFTGADFAALMASRTGSGNATLQGSGTYASDFCNPFRPQDKSSFVPEGMIDDQGDEDGTDFLRKHPTVNQRLFEMNSGTVYQNTGRNQYFANMPSIRMPNMATTRSSVYAIWLTVGFFEVDENGLLGREVGWDSGESVRHRAFSIFDRSIPVAFEPGKNHNIERAILVKSIIE